MINAIRPGMYSATDFVNDFWPYDGYMQPHFLEEALLPHLFRPLEHHHAVPTALDAFGQTDARATVRDIARHIGLSQRRFIQVFTEEIGLTLQHGAHIKRNHLPLAD